MYTHRLHAFITRRFKYVEPLDLPVRPPEYASILRHALASLRRVKKSQPDLAIADISTGTRNIMAARWVKKHGCKLLIIVQGRRQAYRFRGAPAKWLVRKCENHLIRLADIVLVNSQYIARYVREGARRDAAIVICPPGMDTITGIRRPETRFDSQTCLDLLAVGECTEPRKGIRYLLEALPRITGKKVTLNLAGGYSTDSAEFKMMQEIINRHNLASQVVFHGFLEREALANLYASSDIFVLPSLSEGYGIVLAGGCGNHYDAKNYRDQR